MSEPKEWVIRKGGYYYRPNKSGYTAEECAAGRYTEADAKAEARIEPDKMFALHLPWKPCNPAAEAEIARLRAQVAGLREALRALDREARYLTQQLAARGLPGRPGDTVDKVLAASAAAVASAEDRT